MTIDEILAACARRAAAQFRGVNVACQSYAQNWSDAVCIHPTVDAQPNGATVDRGLTYVKVEVLPLGGGYGFRVRRILRGAAGQILGEFPVEATYSGYSVDEPALDRAVQAALVPLLFERDARLRPAEPAERECAGDDVPRFRAALLQSIKANRRRR